MATCKTEYVCSSNPFIIQDTWVANTHQIFFYKKREFRFSTKFLGIHSDLVENVPLFNEFIGAQRTKASAAVLSLGDIKGIFERWTIGAVFSPSWPGRGEVASNSPVKCDGAFVVDIRGTSILGEVRNVWISRATRHLLCSKSHDFLAIFVLAHSKINQIA